jgi:hypothetical protein
MENSRRQREDPSDLAVDLAMSRVALAALKAKVKVPPDDEESESAALLRDEFRRRLAAHGTPHLTPAPTSQQNLQQLNEILQTLSPFGILSRTKAPERLEALLPLLDSIAERTTLSAEEAADLLTGLAELGPHEESIQAVELPSFL